MRAAPIRQLSANIAAAWLAVAVLGVAAPARAGFVVIDLGTLPGGTSSQGMAINATGQVAGTAGTGIGLTHAVIGSGQSGLTDLGTLPGGAVSQGLGINSAGNVTGSSDVRVGTGIQTHAFITNGGMKDLGTFAGGLWSNGYGVNSAGEVAGTADFGGGIAHAFTSTGGPLVDLHTLGGASSEGFAINDAGIVTGSSTTSFGALHAFKSGGPNGLIDLGTLPGDSTSEGLAINTLGQVVGYSSNLSGLKQAFLLSTSNVMQPLGGLAGSTASQGLGINDNDWVVGSSSFSGGGSRAWLWTPTSGGLLDLNQFVAPGSSWTLESAQGINDNGQIVGFGTVLADTANGPQLQTHAFLLQPTPGPPFEPSTPEPSSLVLVVVGAVGIWLCKQRLRP